MKTIFMYFLSIIALGGVSCSNWTEVENLDFRRLTPEEQNPDAYRKHLADVCNYKRSEHRVTMVSVAGSAERPNRQHLHLTSLPDSVDYVWMTNYENLHSDYVQEMIAIRESKGTQTLCVIDYATIETAWRQEEEKRIEAGLPGRTMEEFIQYCRERTIAQLAYCARYGFSGIVISYTGDGSELAQNGQQVFINSITDWRKTHIHELMFFRGSVRNLLQKRFLADCDYIVLPVGTSASAGELTILVQMTIDAEVPTDRFIPEITLPSQNNPIQTGATAETAASWVMQSETEFTKVGIAIANGADDYFNSDMIYKNTRRAISIMNPVHTN